MKAATLPSIVMSDTATPGVPSTRRMVAIGAPEKRLVVLATTMRGWMTVDPMPAPSSVSGLVMATCSGNTPIPTKTVSPDSAWLTAAWIVMC